MKRNYWWIFGVIQAAGALAAVEGLYFDSISALLALPPMLLLLPGSLIWLPMVHTEYFGIGITWLLWSNATAITVNVLLFALVSFLATKFSGHRKPN